MRAPEARQIVLPLRGSRISAGELPSAAANRLSPALVAVCPERIVPLAPSSLRPRFLLRYSEHSAADTIFKD